MSRIAKIQDAKSHRIRLVEKDRELLLVRGGKHAYLWVGPLDPQSSEKIYTICGENALRNLAYAILQEVGK